MQLPLQITFRHMEKSEALEARIREKAEKLEKFASRITSCRVVVEQSHKHKHKGNGFQIHLDITVPGEEILVSRESDGNHGHADPYIVVRDAFESAKRQIEDFVKKQRGDVKNHHINSQEPPSE